MKEHWSDWDELVTFYEIVAAVVGTIAFGFAIWYCLKESPGGIKSILWLAAGAGISALIGLLWPVVLVVWVFRQF